MAETQEDKTFGVKTLLYKEPLFQAEKHRLLMAMGVAIPLLWLVSECVPSLPKKKKEKTKPLCDEIGLIPRPLTYLLFPLEQQLALKISFQFIFNPKAWVFSWSLAGSLFPQPKQKSTLSCSLFLLAAKRILGKQKYRVP